MISNMYLANRGQSRADESSGEEHQYLRRQTDLTQIVSLPCHAPQYKSKRRRDCLCNDVSEEGTKRSTSLAKYSKDEEQMD